MGRRTRIIRVFPRRTQATPDDELAFVGDPPLPEFLPKADVVHVSCSFTWDLPVARRLVVSWRRFYGHVTLGGPAVGWEAEEFVPGRYLRLGHVITSRGCPRRCAHCLVPQREGAMRTLPIGDGWIVEDNNLLACPVRHIEAVFKMLSRQPAAARFTGGLEAARVTPAIARRLVELGFDTAYTAYDRAEQRAHVERAVNLLREAGGWSLRRSQRKLGCYVLCGYGGDTVAAIESRLEWVMGLGATPFPMFYRPPADRKDQRIEAMKRTLRKWMRPASIYAASKPPTSTEQLSLW